jgi:DNA-binding Lrp family transcriptional regulator
MKLSEFKKQIKENIIDILSEVEDTASEKAASTAQINAEKAKIKAAQEKIANLQKGVNESEGLDEMARTAAKLTIADKETAAAIKEKFKGKWLEKMIDIIMDAGAEGISQPEVAKMLDKVQPAINPQVRALTASGVIKLTGAAPSEPKEKEPKVKMFKPKAAAIPKDEAPEDVKDTYYDVDAEDIGFDDEKEPSKADISKNAGSKFSSTGDKYKALVKQMKDVAAKYKSASGEEAKMYVDQLKDLTKEKKRLEAILNPSIGDEDEEF